MFDDDYPDYFIDDDEEDDRVTTPTTPPVERNVPPMESQPNRVIHFGQPRPSRKAPDEEIDYGFDDRFFNDTDDDEEDYSSRQSPADESQQADAQPSAGHGGLIWGGLIAAVVVAAFLYFLYLTPFVADSVDDVRVESVETRGTIFKTHEATLINHSTGKPMKVSIENASDAKLLQQLQGSGQPVRIHLSRYRSSLPWRGESTTVVTSVQQ